MFLGENRYEILPGKQLLCVIILANRKTKIKFQSAVQTYLFRKDGQVFYRALWYQIYRISRKKKTNK